MGPTTEASEEMALREFLEVRAMHVDNAAAFDNAARNGSLIDQLLQPIGHERIDLVVPGERHLTFIASSGGVDCGRPGGGV